MPSFQVLVLGFLFVSFHPSSLRSHSCSTSACLPLSPSACPLPIHFLINRFSSGSDYSALCFFLSALCPLRLTVGSSSRFRFLASPTLFPFRSAHFRSLPVRFRLLSPLFFLSVLPQFRLTAVSLLAASALASSVPPFSPAWFPMPSSPVLLLGSSARFLSSFPASLPQLFHR